MSSRAYMHQFFIVPLLQCYHCRFNHLNNCRVHTAHVQLAPSLLNKANGPLMPVRANIILLMLRYRLCKHKSTVDYTVRSLLSPVRLDTERCQTKSCLVCHIYL